MKQPNPKGRNSVPIGFMQNKNAMSKELFHVLNFSVPKLEATSIDEMIDKLTELKQETATNGNRVKSLFTIAVIEVGVK